MRTIHALVVENHDDQLDMIKQVLNLEFEERWNWKVRWTRCRTATDALKKVRDAETFDFAIVDLSLGEGRLTGMSVAEALKKRNARTFVVVMTGHTDAHPDFTTDAAAIGAHAIVRQQLISRHGEWSFPRLAKRVWHHLTADTPKFDYDTTDIGICSVLESIGGPGGGADEGAVVARRLAIDCIDSVSMRNPVFRLDYLTAGKSGAYVCRVAYSDEGEPSQSFVLKIGLDRRALEHELEGNRQAAKVLSESVLVKIASNVCTDQSGYSAVIARVADRSVPLSTWLANGPSVEQASSLARKLFQEELRGLSSVERSTQVPGGQWMSSSPIMKLRLHAMVKRMGDILGHPSGAALPDADEVRRRVLDFIDTGALAPPTSKRLSHNVFLVNAFGDLHSSNVLVQQGEHPRPLLIDASHFGDHHWSVDPARLAVDLLLRVRATGLPSMLWEDFDDSLQLASRLCPLCGADQVTADEPVTGFIREIVSGLPRVVRFDALGLEEPSWHWQWHVGVAKEFLRQGCHLDLPVARGVLALAAGAHHLERGRVLAEV